MVTQIQLGNIFSSNGKNVLSGSSSGIDTEGLLKSLAEAKRLPAVQIESRIERNGNISTAYGELRTIMTRFQDAANFLRNPPGVQNEDDNIFLYRTATIGSNTAVDGETYFTATIEPGTVAQNYTISEITSLAAAKKQTSNTFAISDADQVNSIIASGRADLCAIGRPALADANWLQRECARYGWNQVAWHPAYRYDRDLLQRALHPQEKSA